MKTLYETRKLTALSQKDFEDCVLSHNEWVASKGKKGKKLIFENYELRHLSFSFIRKQNLSLRRAEIVDSLMNYCDLSTIDCTGANFRGTSMIGTNVSYCKFIGANFEDANLSKAIETGANFEDAYTGDTNDTNFYKPWH